MDIDKIETLTSIIKSAKGFKYEVNGDREINFKGNFHKCISASAAKELARELQEAIDPIIKKYEAELRKQLALCAKLKD